MQQDVGDQSVRPDHPGYEETLRRLTLNDEAFVRTMLVENAGVSPHGPDRAQQSLDDRTRRLVTLGALIAIDAGATAIDAAVTAAMAAGASVEELVEVLLAIAPSIGSARVVSAAPHIAAAVGYDLSLAFEELSSPVRPGSGLDPEPR